MLKLKRWHYQIQGIASRVTGSVVTSESAGIETALSKIAHKRHGSRIIGCRIEIVRCELESMRQIEGV